MVVVACWAQHTQDHQLFFVQLVRFSLVDIISIISNSFYLSRFSDKRMFASCNGIVKVLVLWYDNV